MTTQPTYASSEPAVVSVPEAARLLGIGQSATYRLVREGRLDHFKVGRTIRIPRAAIAKFLDAVVA